MAIGGRRGAERGDDRCLRGRGFQQVLASHHPVHALGEIVNHARQIVGPPGFTPATSQHAVIHRPGDGAVEIVVNSRLPSPKIPHRRGAIPHLLRCLYSDARAWVEMRRRVRSAGGLADVLPRAVALEGGQARERLLVECVPVLLVDGLTIPLDPQCREVFDLPPRGLAGAALLVHVLDAQHEPTPR